MSEKANSNQSGATSGGFHQLPSDSDFYAGSRPEEKPLYQDRQQQQVSDARRVRKTGRHQAVKGRRKENVDIRDKMALIAILKAGVMILLLLIVFFMLWKGIKLYEESIFLETVQDEEVSPVMQEVTLIEEFDIKNQDTRELFAERIEVWKEADRLVRSAGALLSRNNVDQAISRCQDALRLDPAHMQALELLGTLYFEKEMYIEAINSYVRLLSVDPSRSDLQVKLIEALDAYGDAKAVIFMSQWYQEEHPYNPEVQRHMASALFQQEEFEAAADAYGRVLKDSPNDIDASEKQAQAYMYQDEYEKALAVLDKLLKSNYRNQDYYHNLVICHAQLGHAEETVQTLGKAAHLFGQEVVVGWVQDPRLDPIREERTFQAFADRVGGEEFRKWLEKVAKTMEDDGQDNVAPQLEMPKDERRDPDLLKTRRQQ